MRCTSLVVVPGMALAMFCTLLAPAGHAADGSGVDTLREQVEQLREAQDLSEARIKELESRDAAVLGIDDVDRRIEEFEDWTWSRLFLAGYATASFVDAEGAPSTFGLQYNPSFHFRMLDDLHFNAEVEFGFEELRRCRAIRSPPMIGNR